MSSKKSKTKGKLESDVEVRKSPGDLNEYAYFVLPNKVKVFLIQDNNQMELESDIDSLAFCSMSVNVGSLNDPMDRQGLAHFLEHMIFMGSEKYPEEAGYSEHVTAHGGFCNAFTEFEQTNYQF